MQEIIFLSADFSEYRVLIEVLPTSSESTRSCFNGGVAPVLVRADSSRLSTAPSRLDRL